jgi:xanthine dehydrogenase YagS FAD-binding subunit
VNRFSMAEPRTFQEAGTLLTDKRFKLPVLKAGGMDIVDHLKEGLIEPDLLINIKRLRMEGMTEPVSMVQRKGPPLLRIEATATLDQIAHSDTVLKQAPVVAQAVESAATPQVRNVATAAGNLLQRPRCWYYRNASLQCLKKGGSTCFAAEGENKYHAIFGDGPCHIVHPSNLAVALSVCNGSVYVIGGSGGRTAISIAELYHMPDKGVGSEHNLEKAEVVTAIALEPAPTSGFYSIKEKQSFDWPLVMAAVALEMAGETITAARVCAGAVAPVPWRLPKVEEALKGVSIADAAALKKAVAGAAEGAKPMTDNAYKVKLLPVAVHRALLKAIGRNPEPGGAA